MSGPFLLIRASYSFAQVGFRLFVRLLGAKRGKAFFWGGFALSAVAAVYLQLTH